MRPVEARASAAAAPGWAPSSCRRLLDRCDGDRGDSRARDRFGCRRRRRRRRALRLDSRRRAPWHAGGRAPRLFAPQPPRCGKGRRSRNTSRWRPRPVRPSAVGRPRVRQPRRSRMRSRQRLERRRRLPPLAPGSRGCARLPRHVRANATCCRSMIFLASAFAGATLKHVARRRHRIVVTSGLKRCSRLAAARARSFQWLPANGRRCDAPRRGSGLGASTLSASRRASA